MALYAGIKLLSVAILVFCISIEVNDAKKVCSLQFSSTELQDDDVEVGDGKPVEKLEHDKKYWRWICTDGNEIATGNWTEIYAQENEEPRKRVQRGWGSRRRSSSSGDSRGRSSSSTSRRRSSSGWGSRRRTPPSTSRRRTASNVRRRTVSTVRRRTVSTVRRRTVSTVRRRTVSTIRRRTVSTVRRRTVSTVRRRTASTTRRRTAVSTPKRTQSGSVTRRAGSSRKRFWGRKPKTESQKKKNSKAWDKVHTALDIAGLVPGIGNVADGVNAGLHAARGNWKDAALSAASMIPGAGQAATAARIAKKSGKAIKGATKAMKSSTKAAKGTKKVVELIKDKVLEKSKGLKEFLERALKKRGSKKTSSNLREFEGKSVLDRKHTNKKGKTESIKRSDESYDVAKKKYLKRRLGSNLQILG